MRPEIAMPAVLPQICDSAQIEEADEASDEERVSVGTADLAGLEVNQSILGYH